MNFDLLQLLIHSPHEQRKLKPKCKCYVFLLFHLLVLFTPLNFSLLFLLLHSLLLLVNSLLVSLTFFFYAFLSSFTCCGQKGFLCIRFSTISPDLNSSHHSLVLTQG